MPMVVMLLAVPVADKEVPKIGTSLSKFHRMQADHMAPSRQLSLTWVPRVGLKKDPAMRSSNAAQSSNQYRSTAV